MYGVRSHVHEEERGSPGETQRDIGQERENTPQQNKAPPDSLFFACLNIVSVCVPVPVPVSVSVSVSVSESVSACMCVPFSCHILLSLTALIYNLLV